MDVKKSSDREEIAEFKKMPDFMKTYNLNGAFWWIIAQTLSTHNGEPYSSITDTKDAQPDLFFQLVTMINPIVLQETRVAIYSILEGPQNVVITLARFSHGGFNLGLNCAEVFYSASNYIKLRKSIFDFPFVRKLMSSLKFPFCYDAFHGNIGAYVKHIIVDEIVAPESSLLNCKPMDFGGGHLEPNLTYAKELVACMGLGNSVRLQHYLECRSKLAKIAGSKKPTSIIKGALYIWSAFISVFVQHYYVNPFINKVFTLEQYFACLVDALSSFVEDLYRLGAIDSLYKNVTGTIVSNATMWNTLKLVPPEAVQKYYSEGINMILQCESFMHLHLVLDAKGMCSDLGLHHVVVNNYKREVDAYQKFLLLSVPSVLIPNLAPLGKHVFNAYLPGTKPFEVWKNLYNLEDKVVFNEGVML